MFPSSIPGRHARAEEESERWPGNPTTPEQMLVCRMTSFCAMLATGPERKCTGLPKNLFLRYDAAGAPLTIATIRKYQHQDIDGIPRAAS
jgi:hypothetical protein